MADVYVNALTTLSSAPTTTDSIVCVNRNTNEGQIIDYNLLADVILNKITSKTYSSLTTTSKLLTGAINELDADVTSLNSSFNGIKQNVVAIGNTTTTITFSNTAGSRRLMVLGHATDTPICGIYLLIDSAVIALVGASALTVTTDGTTVTITSTATRNASGFII